MAMLRPTSGMKDSGIEWMGLIPQDWGMAKLKYLGTYINGYAFKPDDWSGKGKPIIRIQDLTGSNTGEPNYYDGKLDSKYLVSSGDILVSWAATLDAFVWNNGEGWLNQHIFKAIPVDTINKHYYLWLLKIAMDNMNNDNKHGIVMQHVTTGLFNNYQIPLAPLPEQQIIANYLDDRCSKLDEIITEAEKSIEEYKELKQAVIHEAVIYGIQSDVPKINSGFSWMGYVPTHWKRSTILRCMSFSGGSQPPASEFIDYPADGYVRLIQNRDYRTDAYKTYVPINMVTKFCDEDDVMIGRYGPPLFVIHRGLKGAYNVALMKATPILIDREFMFYYLQDATLVNYIESFSTRTAGQSGVNTEILRKYPIFIPSMEDQNAIVEYLDKRTAQIDALISEKQALIDDLQVYKKSLIYEVVTGKRRVV